MKTASFHTTARKAILAVLDGADFESLIYDDKDRHWHALDPKSRQRLAGMEPSDVSYAADADDYGMFDCNWRSYVDQGGELPHASRYRISDMLIAIDGSVWEVVCCGLELLGKE
ncbi:hypothetical protein DXC37_08905 [Bifidobacterium bifidum]|uniref:hypothetical protein n=1 Tax=Bifidobacterium bifidum TaxID=1681 RepID=UPI000E44C2E3|nr:hypothetical protein [Bifidobacterium bifidum]RGL95043.1 hypothetical protein DXC37_08905 [Bifidobacterium bifidum]RHA93658.1 hypothetical protein DW909_08220 [Bifidobacterium bifidum]